MYCVYQHMQPSNVNKTKIGRDTIIKTIENLPPATPLYLGNVSNHHTSTRAIEPQEMRLTGHRSNIFRRKKKHRCLCLPGLVWWHRDATICSMGSHDLFCHRLQTTELWRILFFFYHSFFDRCALRTHNTQIGIVPLFVWEEIARASSVVVLYAFPLVKRITNVWDGANKRERLRQTILLRPFDFRSGHPRLQSYIDAQCRGRGDSSFITKERNQAASSAQMVIPHMVYVMWWIYDISNDMICIQRRLIRPLDFRLLFVLPLPPP